MSTADDRDLERYLRRDDALSRAYAELESERPSPALDQAVLARARDALKAAPRSDRPRHRNWTALTALAATVLLSFGLVMRLALEPESQTPAAPAAQDAVTPLPQASMPAAEPERTGSERDSSAVFAPPQQASAPASSIEDQRPVIEHELRAVTEQVPAAPEPVPPAVVPQREYARPAPAPAPTLNDVRKRASAAGQPLRQERASGPTAGQGTARAMKSGEEAESLSGVAVTGSTAPASEPALAKEDFTRTPEAWLAEIARLRAAGETEAADRELERFRKAYPEYLEKLKPHEPQPQ